ncbi:MAG: diacylglycerol kinase family protein [Bifidobacterium sp.]|nr:diacylglycerol kinase family protein [Bifidobacterium sp.]
MTKNEEPTVAVIGNPASAKGAGAKYSQQVLDLLQQAGEEHGFTAIDLTGTSYDDSLANARERWDDYDYLVVVGGDGMVSLGVNAVGGTDKPLGLVAMGSGNDFARGLELPVNRLETAVEGIVAGIVRHCQVPIDLGHVTSVPGSDSVALHPTTGEPGDDPKPIDRYYAGMLSCGLDSGVNDRANKSKLPNGTLRYLSAVLYEVTHFKKYGYHLHTTLTDGTEEDYDLMTAMLTVANSRHIGGGIAISPYSIFDDGLLDLVWLRHTPKGRELAKLLMSMYQRRLMAGRALGWQRVRNVRISRAEEGDEPPVLMADGEYVGTLPVDVSVVRAGFRLLVPPAVQAGFDEGVEDKVLAEIARDGRDPATGLFLDELAEDASSEAAAAGNGPLDA